MNSKIKISILVYIIALLSINSIDMSAKQVITWDRIGQEEKIKKGETFDFLYRKANPENTRILLKPSNKADEFVLELIRYNIVDKALENKKSDQVANDSLVRFLNKENSDLIIKIKNNKIFVDYDSAISSTIIKTSKILVNQNKSNENIDKEELLANSKKTIAQITASINKNQSESSRNVEIIDRIREKIKLLGTSKSDLLLVREYSMMIDSIERRNKYLSQENNLLSISKSLLVKDNRIVELELARQLTIRNVFFIIALISLIFAFFYYRNFKKVKKLASLLQEQKEIIIEEQAKSETLLLNVLPHSIANRLKAKEHPIADYFDNASILFIDIVGFTELSTKIDPKKLVEILGSIFTKFDQLAEKYGLEKIKTIGDSYMAVSGIPSTNKLHALAAAQMALEIKDTMNNYKSNDANQIQFRIGLDNGPVIAGVIGEKKFIYDLWGDAVNTAARMESNGAPGQVHITERFKDELLSSKSLTNENNKFNWKFVDRGEIEIKGKGMMKTYFLSSK